MNSLFCLMLLGTFVVIAHSGPTNNRWDVPCDGYLVAMEAICGGETTVSDSSRAVSDPRSKRSANATNSETILSRQKRTDADFSCTFDYPICSIGLKESLCNNNCEGYFSWSGTTLYVDAPCNGVFTVILCKP